MREQISISNQNGDVQNFSVLSPDEMAQVNQQRLSYAAQADPTSSILGSERIVTVTSYMGYRCYTNNDIPYQLTTDELAQIRKSTVSSIWKDMHAAGCGNTADTVVKDSPPFMNPMFGPQKTDNPYTSIDPDIKTELALRAATGLATAYTADIQVDNGLSMEEKIILKAVGARLQARELQLLGYGSMIKDVVKQPQQTVLREHVKKLIYP